MSSVTRFEPSTRTREYLLGEGFRCLHYLPAGSGPSRGVCVIIPSGQAGALDERTEETVLYERLAALLAHRGIGTVRFDVAPRADRVRPATAAEVVARTLRLLMVLRTPVLREALVQPVLLGLSLGVQSALDLVSARLPLVRPAGLVLVGRPVVAPMRMTVPLAGIHLVYGGEDLVQFVREDGVAGPLLAPDVYAPSAAAMLRVPGGVRPAVHILPGLDHMLMPVTCSGDAPDAVPVLADLVDDLLTHAAILAQEAYA